MNSFDRFLVKNLNKGRSDNGVMFPQMSNHCCNAKDWMRLQPPQRLV